MKRSLALAGMLLMTLTACGGNESDTGEGSASAVVASSAKYTVDFPGTDHDPSGEGFNEGYGYEVRAVGQPLDSCDSVILHDIPDTHRETYKTKADAQAAFNKVVANVAKLRVAVLDAGHPIDRPEVTEYSVYLEPPDDSIPESRVGTCLTESHDEAAAAGANALKALKALAQAKH